MEPVDNSDQNSNLSFGSNNIFKGPIRNVAGRDINLYRTIIQNFIGNYQTDITSIIIAENDFAQAVKHYYSSIDKFHVVTNLRIEVEQRENKISPEFEEDFSPELLSLLKDTSFVETTPQKSVAIDYKNMLIGNNKLLIAPLGYGKTTILKMLALEAVNNHLTISNSFKSQPGRKLSLEDYVELRLPIYIDLSKYDVRLSLIDFIKQYAWRDNNGELRGWTGSIVYSLFDLFLAKGKFILLLDSLDYLGNIQFTKILSEVEWLILNYPNNLIVISSRNEDVFYELGFSRVFIEKWGCNQIHEFFQKRLGKAKGEYVYRIITEEYPQLSQWISVPYISFATAIYYSEYGSLPKEINTIVDKLVTILIKRGALKDQKDKHMNELFERFLSDAAFKSVAAGLNLQLQPEILDSTAQLLGINQTEAVNECLEIGFLEIGEENSINFKNHLVGHYFVGKYLLETFQHNKEEFSKIIHFPLVHEQVPTYKRSALFRKPVIGSEIAWDHPLPRVEKSKWFEGLSMTFTMLDENQNETFLETLINSNCITAGELIEQFKSKISDKSRQRIVHQLVSISSDPKVALRARLKSLFLLGALGDPRIGNSKMQRILEGKAALGVKDKSHYFYVPEFLLDTFPVTNEQYREFILAGGYSNSNWWTEAGFHWLQNTKRIEPAFWNDSRYNSPNQPVVGITWYEANAYCRWAQKRLPTEAEWERAACWDERTESLRKFPVGNELFEGIGNLLITEYEYVFCTTPVGAFPLGVSNDGVYDLVGNVWEWLDSTYNDPPNRNEGVPNLSTNKQKRCL